MKTYWRAISISQGAKGLVNSWHCSSCGEHCVVKLPLNDEPDDKCVKEVQNE